MEVKFLYGEAQKVNSRGVELFTSKRTLVCACHWRQQTFNHDYIRGGVGKIFLWMRRKKLSFSGEGCWLSSP